MYFISMLFTGPSRVRHIQQALERYLLNELIYFLAIFLGPGPPFKNGLNVIKPLCIRKKNIQRIVLLHLGRSVSLKNPYTKSLFSLHSPEERF